MLLTVLISAVLGFLSGMGVGGGSLMMLWLTLGAGMPQEMARTINLMYFIPSASIACLFHRKNGALPLTKVLPAVIAGIVSTTLFTLWSADWNTDYLRKAFGLLLVITGIRELMFRSTQ